MGHVRPRGRLGWLSCMLLASLSGLACSSGDPTSFAPSPGGDGPLGARGQPLSPTLDCGGTRWIAIKNVAGASCSTYAPSASWTGDLLFSTAAGPLPDDLLRYCVFTWIGPPPATPPAAEIANLQGNPDISNVVEDCPVIVPQSPAVLQEALAREQRGWIHAAAGGLTSLPPSISPLRPIRLAVVDNAPESLDLNVGVAALNPLPAILPRTTAPPFGEHGEVLAYLGRDLGCPEGENASAGCAVHAETVLAMMDGNPGSQPGSPGYAGGLFGKRGDLAAAIQRAVEDWKGDVLSTDSAEPRLVLNLSLGWEDHSTDSKATSTRNCSVAHADELDSPSRAVYDAIVYARCHGALVLAAAGNDTGGPAPVHHAGLTCPARFMQWDAPDKTTCGKRMLVKTPSFESNYAHLTGLVLRPNVTGRVYDPLVHPVGGVDYGDVPLVPHRPASLPQLVAPGLLGSSYEADFATFASGAIPPLHAPYSLSGTSVSTVIASAIAATAWAYAPNLAPANVMALLHASGAALGPSTPVEVVRPQGVMPGSTVVRRASLCQTLLGMGIAVPGECERSGPRSDHGPQNPPMSQATTAIFASYYTSANQAQVSVTPVPLAVTPLGSTFTEAAAFDVSPQPPWPTCPTCGFAPSDGSSPVILYLDPVLPLASPYLVVDGIAYGSAPGGAPLLQTAGTITTLILTGLPQSVGTNSRAFLVWKDAGNNAVHAQLPILY
jgi:subtilase family protein